MKPILIFLTVLTSFAGLAAERPPFDFRADLAYMHKGLLESQPYSDWKTTHTLRRWSESPRDSAGRRSILLQEEGPVTSSAILGIEVEAGGNVSPAPLHREFTKAEVTNSYNEAKGALSRAKLDLDIVTAYPVLDLRASAPLTWRVRLAGRSPRIVAVTAAGIVSAVAPARIPVVPHACTPGVDDALSQDDLHHLNGGKLLAYVLSQVKDVREVHDSAIRLNHAVFNDIEYSMFDLADLYTDSDTVVLERNFGMCDEKAVVLVTYLRTIGIPSRIKFLRWLRDGEEQAHACVEYDKDGISYHLDPTWDVVHDRTIYRNTDVDGSKPTKVKAVDVDWPADARSATNIGNYPDVDDDGRLNPWEDFCYSPCKEGDPDRPGYSKD
ncbi:MAG: hypothetical protein QOI24_2412 [Acidobacteriota bacterium]|jgi:transglutaminase-like putative cysteine protease|nr:hypothetical protein [Acidobacteriota bacterium]